MKISKKYKRNYKSKKKGGSSSPPRTEKKITWKIQDSTTSLEPATADSPVEKTDPLGPGMKPHEVEGWQTVLNNDSGYWYYMDPASGNAAWPDEMEPGLVDLSQSQLVPYLNQVKYSENQANQKEIELLEAIENGTNGKVLTLFLEAKELRNKADKKSHD